MSGIGIDLAGKKALVTGGSRGIGRAIAVRLAEAGCDVAINYVRNRGPAGEAAALVEKAGRKALLCKVNVANTEKLGPMFEQIAEQFGCLDILVSNAASGVIKPALELTRRHWHLSGRTCLWHSNWDGTVELSNLMLSGFIDVRPFVQALTSRQ